MVFVDVDFANFEIADEKILNLVRCYVPIFPLDSNRKNATRKNSFAMVECLGAMTFVRTLRCAKGSGVRNSRGRAAVNKRK